MDYSNSTTVDPPMNASFSFASSPMIRPCPNKDTPQRHSSIFETPRLFVGYWELFVCIFGTPANLLVLYLTATFIRGNYRRASAASYHQSNLWFVASMTLADAVFCAIHSPMMVAQYVFRVQSTSASCFLMYIITHATTISSSLSLLCLNVDKFLYLNRPLHYHNRVTSVRALLVVGATWTVSTCWAVFFMLGPFSRYNPPCDFRPSEIHFYILFALCFFVLPTLISMSISVYIASVVIRVSKENALRKNSSRSSQTSGHGTGGGNGHHQATSTSSSSCGTFISATQRTTNAKAIAFVFTTTLWSSITYLPYRFAYVLYISPGFKEQASWSMTTAFYVLFAVMATNAAGNPLITIVTQRRYTMAVGHLWRSIRASIRGKEAADAARRKSSSNANTSLMTFQSMASKMSIIKREGKTAQKLIEDLEAESAM